MSRKYDFLSSMDLKVLQVFHAHPRGAATSVSIANQIGSCTCYPNVYLKRLEAKGLVEVADKQTYPYIWNLKK